MDEVAVGSLAPVINAGDGPGIILLKDLWICFTMQRGLGRLDDFHHCYGWGFEIWACSACTNVNCS